MSLCAQAVVEGLAARVAKADEAAMAAEKAEAPAVLAEEEVVVSEDIVVEAAKKVGVKEELVV